MYLPLVRAACLAGLLLFAGCASAPRPDAAAAAAASASDPAPLLLVSIDGLRADAVGRGEMPNLDRLATEGVRAAWMNPSYPSLTFPNHYTLVTGLRPDHHGVVHNTMRVQSLGSFRSKDKQAVGDGRWWSGAEPLWVGAEKAGLRTATMYWPGSEAEIDGIRPSQWRAYDGDVSAQQRVEQVLAWLDLPAIERPRLVTLYFNQVDEASHDAGPDSAQAHAGRVEVDAALGLLRRGLEARGLFDASNLVVVSDHGFADTPAQQYIAVEDMVDPHLVDVVTTDQVVGFAPKPSMERQAEHRLLGRHDHYECWRKAELPQRWHYGENRRIPPIVCQMDEGWNAKPRADLQAMGPERRKKGAHGYDPALPSMRASFVAHGPAFRSGVTIPAFDNVDVYPLLARLLGLRVRTGDGDIAPLLPALKDANAKQ